MICTCNITRENVPQLRNKWQRKEKKHGIYAKILVDKEHNWEELIQLSEKVFKKITNLTSKEN